MDTGVDKQRTVSSAELSNMSDVYSLFEFSWQICPVFVRCLDNVRILCPVSVCPDSVCLDSVRCLSVRILSVPVLSAIQNLSEIFEKTLSVVCLSGRTRTRQSCLDFRCPCRPTSAVLIVNAGSRYKRCQGCLSNECYGAVLPGTWRTLLRTRIPVIGWERTGSVVIIIISQR